MEGRGCSFWVTDLSSKLCPATYQLSDREPTTELLLLTFLSSRGGGQKCGINTNNLNESGCHWELITLQAFCIQPATLFIISIYEIRKLRHRERNFLKVTVLTLKFADQFWHWNSKSWLWPQSFFPQTNTAVWTHSKSSINALLLLFFSSFPSQRSSMHFKSLLFLKCILRKFSFKCSYRRSCNSRKFPELV